MYRFWCKVDCHAKNVWVDEPWRVAVLLMHTSVQHLHGLILIGIKCLCLSWLQPNNLGKYFFDKNCIKYAIRQLSPEDKIGISYRDCQLSITGWELHSNEPIGNGWLKMADAKTLRFLGENGNRSQYSLTKTPPSEERIVANHNALWQTPPGIAGERMWDPNAAWQTLHVLGSLD